MARTPMKREAFQTVDSMAEQLMESSAKNKVNRLYPDASAEVKRQALANAVNQQRELMKITKQRGRRIDLNDLDEVEACVESYMQSCIKANCIPSMMGFAAASGWSRKSIYQYIATHKGESALYLDNLRSSWAAIMAQLALTRQASEAVSIFLLKNSGQDLTDKCELTAIPALPDPVEEMNVDEIARRYIVDYKPDADTNTETGGDLL